MDESRLTSTSMNEVLERFKAGKPAALSRGISIVENQRDGFEAFLHAAMQTKLQGRRIGPVSYTHLTLPTNREV